MKIAAGGGVLPELTEFGCPEQPGQPIGGHESGWTTPECRSFLWPTMLALAR
jgi:hypothetical protein